MDGDFRQKAASALTHPVTVGSLAILLLNDVLFKSLWPHAWFTGKLSELAWLVLALPLLAILLSLLVRANLLSGRASFFIVYIGLPLLYLAYNTFEVGHHWILWGISVASGGTAGSPQDVIDALVIALAWAIALWVWHRGPVPGRTLRMRGVLLVAAVVFLVGVAYSNPAQVQGVTSVGIDKSGSVHAPAHGDRDFSYYSVDGGVTWKPEKDERYDIAWGGSVVETPRGRNVLEGPEINSIDVDGQQIEVIYPVASLGQGTIIWTQEHETGRFRSREIADQPSRILSDSPSDNVIPALGHQGVLVGTPDGGSIDTAVGPFTPADFSFISKTWNLLSSLQFWTAAMALSLSMTGAALILSRSWSIVNWKTPLMAIVVGVVLIGMFFIFFLIAGLNLFIPFLIALGVWELHQRREWRTAALLSIGALSLLASGALIFVFGGPDADLGSFSSIRLGPLTISFGGSGGDTGSIHGMWFVPIAIAAYALIITSFAVSWKLFRYWRAITGSILAMAALTVLPFILWLHVGIPIVLAKGLAIALSVVVAISLRNHMKQETIIQVTFCPKCDYENPPSARICAYCELPLKQA